MRATRIVLAFSSVLAATTSFPARAEARATQGRNPLDEQDVVKLLKMGASSEAVAQLVDKYGVGFPVNANTLERLKAAGAQPELIEALERKPSAPAVAPAGVTTSTPPEAAGVARHLEQAQLKTRNRDFAGALREFQEADQLRPGSPQVYYQRGLVLAELGRYPEAAAEWKRMVARAAPGTNTEMYSRQIAEWQERAQRNKATPRLDRVLRLPGRAVQHIFRRPARHPDKPTAVSQSK
jgi:Flp pilus assembly protein TadD